MNWIWSGFFSASIVIAGIFAIHTANAQEKPAQRSELVGHLFLPARQKFLESMAGTLRLPEGFRAQVFARNLAQPRMMAVGPRGIIYVTRPKQNDVIALVDRDGDGRADLQWIALSNLEQVHGIAIHEDRLYLAAPTKIYVADLGRDGTPGKPRILIEGLPDGGQHPNRTIAFGADGFYISVGSSCNACRETNPEHATLLRVSREKDNRLIFARGLRNTIGFDWHPVTGELWGMDHGSDWRGDEQPPEELNHLQQGKNYGWPFCYGNQNVDRYLVAEPEGGKKEDYCPETQAPALTYDAHSAPIAMIFYRGSQFPADYRNDAFVAMHGSWNRKVPSGYSVLRVRFENGQPVRFEDFVTGFLAPDGGSYFGRPAGLAIAPDGALLVSDDANGVIYGVRYDKAVSQR